MKSTGKIISCLVLVLIGAVICAGCITSPAEPSVEGYWILNSSEKITLIFNPDGTFGGQAPVNGFGGTYTVDGSTLILGDEIYATLLAGTPEDMRAEAEFLSSLQNIARWQVTDDKLILADADDRILFIFTAAIFGEWDGADGTSIIFNADGTVRGHAPINSFGGNYEVFGSSFVFDNLFMTEMAGPEKDMKAEDMFISALNTAVGYTIIGNTLTFADAEGKTLLTFKRHFEPTGEWILADDSDVVIRFSGDGDMTGNAQINSFGARYIIAGSSIFFPEGITMTARAGSEKDMKAEDAFFQALGKTTEFWFADGKLVFADENGKTLLTFERE